MARREGHDRKGTHGATWRRLGRPLNVGIQSSQGVMKEEVTVAQNELASLPKRKERFMGPAKWNVVIPGHLHGWTSF